MFRVISRLFAVIGFFVVLLVAGGVAVYMQHSHAAPSEPDSVVLVLDFDQPIVEQDDPSPLDLAMHDDTSTTLINVLRAIDQARDDKHVKALVARFGTTQPNFAQAQEIRDAITRFRESKKPTYAFGSSYGEFGLGNRAYYLASAFENIWLQPVGTVGLTGLAIQQPFARSALEKIGVKGDFMQREEYKSFMDMAMRDDFAPPVRENMQSLLDNMAEQEAKGIGEGRGMEFAKVRGLMEKGPYTDDEALKNSLVTKLGYADELDRELEKLAGKHVKTVSADVYLSYGGKTGVVEKPKAEIAMIYGTGMILDHDVGSGLTGDKVMAADQLAGAFEQVAEDKDIKAILFRVDSPGGSPAASETIRRAIIRAQQAGKPVFVSMGEMAASGGYWISMNADYIAAQPGTLTGSIGVIAGKFDASDLIQKLGVTMGTIRTTGNAGMWSPVSGFTPEQRERVNALLDASYRSFVQNVAAARKIPLEKMPDIAKGRVWTGAQAQKLGLVDELGGYDVTITALRKKLNLKPDDLIDFQQFPAPETPVERVMKVLKGLGIENAAIRGVLVQAQGLRTALAPLLQDAQLAGQPVRAQVPAIFLQAVH